MAAKARWRFLVVRMCENAATTMTMALVDRTGKKSAPRRPMVRTLVAQRLPTRSLAVTAILSKQVTEAKKRQWWQWTQKWRGKWYERRKEAGFFLRGLFMYGCGGAGVRRGKG